LAGSGSGRPVRITWLGDSTAAGVGASAPDRALPRQVAALLDRPVDLTVLAVSGDRVADVRDAQVPDVPSNPDAIVISVGVNDVVHLTRRDDFARRYREVLDGLPPAPVVLLGVPDLGSVSRFLQPLRFIAGVRGGTLDAVIADLSRDRSLGYVDIAGETGPAFRDDPGRYFSADEYHPSDDGYGLWADAVVPVLEEELTDGG
jgi:lysophospholipase L1-like esterase